MFLFFPQMIVIVIVLKLKNPNYYKLLLLYNVTKIYDTFCHGVIILFFSGTYAGKNEFSEILWIKFLSSAGIWSAVNFSLDI